MTIKGLRDGLVQDLAENVYDTYWFGLEGTKMICEALDKQIPMRLRADNILCPRCQDASPIGNYCHNCGQRVYWGDDE